MGYRLFWIALAIGFNVAYWRTHPDMTIYNAYIGPRPQDSIGFLLIIAGVYRYGFEKVVNGIEGPIWYPLLFIAGGMAVAAIS